MSFFSLSSPSSTTHTKYSFLDFFFVNFRSRLPGLLYSGYSFTFFFFFFLKLCGCSAARKTWRPSRATSTLSASVTSLGPWRPCSTGTRRRRRRRRRWRARGEVAAPDRRSASAGRVCPVMEAAAGAAGKMEVQAPAVTTRTVGSLGPSPRRRANKQTNKKKETSSRWFHLKLFALMSRGCTGGGMRVGSQYQAVVPDFDPGKKVTLGRGSLEQPRHTNTHARASNSSSERS